MLGFMETEKEFIKNWEKYRGAAGWLRYLAYWFLLGIIVIPLMLTAINLDIWSTVRMDQLAEEAATFFGLGFWLCILPSLLIGLGTWDKKNRKISSQREYAVHAFQRKTLEKRRKVAVIWDREFDGRIFRLYYFCICYIDDERHRQSRLYV